MEKRPREKRDDEDPHADEGESCRGKLTGETAVPKEFFRSTLFFPGESSQRFRAPLSTLNTRAGRAIRRKDAPSRRRD